MTRLILPILPEPGHRADPCNREESESGHLQPELVQNSAERTSRSLNSLEQSRARSAAPDLLDDQPQNQPDFLRNLGRDHPVDFSSGRAYNNGGCRHKRL